MAEGRSRDAWNHTAALLAQILNVHVSKKSLLRKPSDFHPFTKVDARRKPKRKGSIMALKSTFVTGPLARRLQRDARRVHRKERKERKGGS